MECVHRGAGVTLLSVGQTGHVECRPRSSMSEKLTFYHSLLHGGSEIIVRQDASLSRVSMCAIWSAFFLVSLISCIRWDGLDVGSVLCSKV